MVVIGVLKGFSYRDLNERWQHFSDTIHSIIHHVIKSLLEFGQDSAVPNNKIGNGGRK